MTGTVWVCPVCGVSVTVNVKVSQPPVCTRHAGGGRVMQQQEEARRG